MRRPIQPTYQGERAGVALMLLIFFVMGVAGLCLLILFLSGLAV